MERKFNWGWKIAILYSGFVCFMLFLGYKASNEKVDLVTKNYYDEELKYQDHIDIVHRTDSLHANPDWRVTGDRIDIKFPGAGTDQKLSGTIYFYCPADEQKDFTYPFATAPGQSLSIANPKLGKGAYRMEVAWKEGKSDFFTEGIVKID